MFITVLLGVYATIKHGILANQTMHSMQSVTIKIDFFLSCNICNETKTIFYKGKLKTDRSVPPLDSHLQTFWPAGKSGKNFPIAFCHVEGEEESSSIKTSHSNEQSKSNEKEVRKVVSLMLSKCNS